MKQQIYQQFRSFPLVPVKQTTAKLIWSGIEELGWDRG